MMVGEHVPDRRDIHILPELDQLIIRSLAQLPRLQELSADELHDLAGDLRMLSNVAMGWAERIGVGDTSHRE